MLDERCPISMSHSSPAVPDTLRQPPFLPFLATFYGELASVDPDSSKVVPLASLSSAVSSRIPQFIESYDVLREGGLVQGPRVRCVNGGYEISAYEHEGQPERVDGEALNLIQRAWISRIVVGGNTGGLGCCPFTKSASVAGTGIKGVQEGQVLYLTSGVGCRALSDFYAFCSHILTSTEAGERH